jgi:hypothetical protein
MQTSDATAMATNRTQVARKSEPRGEYSLLSDIEDPEKTHPTSTCERFGIETCAQHSLGWTPSPKEGWGCDFVLNVDEVKVL